MTLKIDGRTKAKLRNVAYAVEDFELYDDYCLDLTRQQISEFCTRSGLKGYINGHFSNRLPRRLQCGSFTFPELGYGAMLPGERGRLEDVTISRDTVFFKYSGMPVAVAMSDAPGGVEMEQHPELDVVETGLPFFAPDVDRELVFVKPKNLTIEIE